MKIKMKYNLSFPQAKRSCLSGRQVGNPSERKIPDKPTVGLTEPPE